VRQREEEERKTKEEAKKESEYVLLRNIEAILVIYRRAYDYQVNLLERKRLSKKGVVMKW
jgi:hypothetical protein